VRIATLPVPARKLRKRNTGEEGQTIGAHKEAKVANDTKTNKKSECKCFQMVSCD
jgi:hypothetical protein